MLIGYGFFKTGVIGNSARWLCRRDWFHADHLGGPLGVSSSSRSYSGEFWASRPRRVTFDVAADNTK
jgi:hypothetical protein